MLDVCPFRLYLQHCKVYVHVKTAIITGLRIQVVMLLVRFKAMFKKKKKPARSAVRHAVFLGHLLLVGVCTVIIHVECDSIYNIGTCLAVALSVHHQAVLLSVRSCAWSV